jgi:hypothetical protein
MDSLCLVNKVEAFIVIIHEESEHQLCKGTDEMNGLSDDCLVEGEKFIAC